MTINQSKDSTTAEIAALRVAILEKEEAIKDLQWEIEELRTKVADLEDQHER